MHGGLVLIYFYPDLDAEAKDFIRLTPNSLSNDTICIQYVKYYCKQFVSYLYCLYDLYAGILEINRICPLSWSIAQIKSSTKWLQSLSGRGVGLSGYFVGSGRVELYT